jgi:EAL domain-containing protein (putative c-di-GMP-specific phosphodiesterase class I)
VDAALGPVGAEVLIRWLHPERGLIYPGDFINVAEESGLILPIGEWVLETACAQLKLWQRHESTRHLTLSVNVSAKQFRENGFVEKMKSIVMRHEVNPMLIKLEPTESILLENIEEAVSIMNGLKAVGIHFALDDFGTGYSSLQYLKKLPLNQLKIDQSFVRDLVLDGNDQAIVRTIIAMAKSLNLDVIAEGVETEDQQKILQSYGCNRYQGYLFSRPVPIEDFERALI